MPLTEGTRLGPYEILSPLGAGGMGEVYRARDTRLDRIVAIKVLRPHVAADPGRRQRFEREARVISQLNHPHICTLFDVGQQDGTPYLVMEYLDGQTLAERLEQSRLPIERVLEYANHIADALAAAHSQGIVHRDLKPANVMLTQAGAMLLDFGIARIAMPALDPPGGKEGPSTEAIVGTLTVDGGLLGTVQYMAPEQLEGREADARSDLFAFGAVLYEMLTGRRAFAGESQSRVIAAVLDTDPPPTSASQPLAPPSLDHLVKTCLTKNPDERWQNADDAKRELQEIALGLGKDYRWRRLLKYAVATTVAIVLATAGSVLLWRHLKVTPLTDKDVLVLADFTNTTGDPVFEGALRLALSIELEQSPFLKIMDEAQVRQDLRFMGRAADDRITHEVAREVCNREGEKATIEGSIARLGRTYVLALEATNCQTRETLAREQTQADDKEHVLEAVAKAATGLRAKLGESLTTIQKLDRPILGQATTSSLEAYQAYSLAMAQLIRGESLAAIPFFKRATDLDPNFAMAWVMQSVAYQGVLGQNGRVLEYERRAFELVDRVLSPKERLFIETNYYRDVTGQLDKFREVSQLHARTYPRDGPPHYGFGLLHNFGGEFEDSVREFEEHNRLGPKVAQGYFQLMLAHVRLDRFEKAKAVAEEAVAQNLDGPLIHRGVLAVAYRQRDRAAAEKEIRWFAGKPEEYQSLSDQADYAKLLGQYRKARELRHQAADVANRWNLPDTAAQLLAPDPLGDALAGNCETARGHPPGAPGQVGVAMALCGEPSAARRVADEASQRLPNNTVLQAIGLPLIRAAIELASDRPAKAIEALAPAAPYERGWPQLVYLRGLAYLRLNDGARAAAEFHRILDHWGAYFGPFYPQSYAGLARAEALRGGTAAARKAYEDFFAFWKDADADIPLLIEARNEYAALKEK